MAIDTCRSNDLMNVKSTTNFTLITPLIGQLIGSLSVGGNSQVTVNQ